MEGLSLHSRLCKQDNVDLTSRASLRLLQTRPRMVNRIMEIDMCLKTRLSPLTKMPTTFLECLNFKPIRMVAKGKNDFQETWILEMHPL